MGFSIKHLFVSEKTPSEDETIVGSDDWNDEHDIEGLRAWELVESKTIDPGTLSATFSDLNGDSDIEYLLVGELVTAGMSNDASIYLKPNNLATNQKNVRHYIVQNGHGYTGNKGYLECATNGTTAAVNITFEAMLKAKTGKIRVLKSRETLTNSDVTYYGLWDFVGFWSDTSANITSLVFTCTSGSFSGTLKLYKRIDLP